MEPDFQLKNLQGGINMKSAPLQSSTIGHKQPVAPKETDAKALIKRLMKDTQNLRDQPTVWSTDQKGAPPKDVPKSVIAAAKHMKNTEGGGDYETVVHKSEDLLKGQTLYVAVNDNDGEGSFRFFDAKGKQLGADVEPFG